LVKNLDFVFIDLARIISQNF